MIAERRAFRVGTYNNGQPYSLPRGRYAPRGQVEDRLAPTHVVVDLDCERPVATKFLGQIVRELRIRFYKAKTVKSYRCALAGFLRWFGNRPHLITHRGGKRRIIRAVSSGVPRREWGTLLGKPHFRTPRRAKTLLAARNSMTSRVEPLRGNYPSWLPHVAVMVLGTAVFAVLMQIPSFDPTGGNRYHTGTMMSVLWCVGLLSWGLRVTRSHQSRFTIRVLLSITTVIAIGCVNIFVALIIVCCAMACDFGVDRDRSNRALVWKVVQSVAGMSGIAHATRVVYHVYLM